MNFDTMSHIIGAPILGISGASGSFIYIYIYIYIFDYLRHRVCVVFPFSGCRSKFWWIPWPNWEVPSWFSSHPGPLLCWFFRTRNPHSEANTQTSSPVRFLISFEPPVSYRPSSLTDDGVEIKIIVVIAQFLILCQVSLGFHPHS